MHGMIPLSRKLIKCQAIPPVFIEIAVCEACQLCKGVGYALEDDREDENPSR